METDVADNSASQSTPLLKPVDGTDNGHNTNGSQSAAAAAAQSNINSSSSLNGRRRGFMDRLVRPFVAELTATALFVFVGTMAVQSADNLLIALAHGLTVSLLIVVFSDVSGAHMNPVVTLGLLLGSGLITWFQSIFHVLAQLIGGILGAALTRGVLSYTPAAIRSLTNRTVYEAIRGGSHILSPGVTPAQGILCEATTTFLLVHTVLMVSRAWNRKLAAFSIGFSVFAGIAATIRVTGGSLNPARSFGPAVVISGLDNEVWNYHYVYWAGPIIGSLIAVVFYRFIFNRRYFDQQTTTQQISCEA